ncbi:MAG: protein kinase, partial [Caldilineales bacterium]|nr:protein kinase [Caldilineales bacterium]
MNSEDRLIGEVFQGQRGRYTLQRLLGAGLTAWVFQGQAELEGGDPFSVAIKVMKPGLGAEEQRRFRAEAEHLAALLSARANAAPVYYEAFATGRADAPEALVLELMTGQKVEKLLESEGPLPEREGLALAVQLTGLLHTLHDQLRRTYTDFKFENLWWQRETRTLKVTDWNVLSASGDLSRVHVDLLRAARYVYTVLTGGEAQERGGRITTPFMRHPGWPQLSLASQGVLRRALHYNAERRFKTAAEMLKAWQAVQGYWE